MDFIRADFFGIQIWQMGLLVLAGGFAGFLNVLAGGGSLITLPIMVFMGMKGPVANGTNRIALLAQNISGTISFFKQGFSDFKLSLSLTTCALPGAAFGALMGTKLEGVWFNRMLAAVMVGVMVLMALKSRKSKGTDVTTSKKRLIIAHICMIGIGFYGGFIQAGVGFLFIAVLNKVAGIDLVRTNMHKIFVVGCYMVVALIIYAVKGNVWWAAGVVLAIGNSTGAWIAAHVAVKKGDKFITIILYCALIVMAVKLLLK
jgi:uncharacterized membrane protein YfcA